VQRWQNVASSVDIWRLAEQSATAQREFAQRRKKAFALGETGLQDLLRIQRHAISAAETSLSARVPALRVAYSLEIDAHQGELGGLIEATTETSSAHPGAR
jgi:hypothetical protein